MAEEVKIVDVAGGPAAEATLQEILKVLKGQGGSGGGSASTKEATKVQDLYTTAVTRGTTVRKKNTKAVEKATSATERFSSVVGGIMGGIGSALGGLVGIATNFGKAMTEATTIGGVLEAVPVFGSVLGQATGYFQNSIDTFRQLSETGGSFGNDMMAMRNASAQAGLNLEQFASMVGNSSANLTLLGGTVSGGAQRMGRLTKQLRSQEMGLMSLGYTQESLNEGFNEYIEMMAASGQLRGRSDRELTAGAANYLTEIDKLARVTGRSRKEMQEEMNQRMAAANYNVLAAQLSGEALLNFQNNTQFTSDMLGQGFADVMSDLGDGVAQSGFAQKLSSVVPGLSDLAEANARGELSQEEYQARLAALAPEIAKFADEMGAAGTSALMQEEGFAEFMESVSRARTLQQRMADAQDAAAEQLERAPLTDTFANFEQTIQNVRSAFETALIESGILDTVGTLLGDLGTGLTSLATGGVKELQDYLGGESFKADMKAFQDWIQKTKDKLSVFLSDVKEKGLVQTIKDMFGTEGEDSSFGTMIGDWISDAIGAMLPSADTILIGLAAGIATLIFAPFLGAFGAIGVAIVAMFGWDTIKQWAVDAWDSITGIFTSIKTWWDELDFMKPISDAWETIKGFFTFGEGESSFSISQLATDAWESVKSWFTFGEGEESFSISQLATDAWESVKGWFTFGETNFSITQIATDAWNTVTSWFTFGEGTDFSISTMATDAWETVKSWFSFEGVEMPSIKDAFNNIKDKVLGFFDFDFEMPDFTDYLPKWLGGKGKSLFGDDEPGTTATASVSNPASQEPMPEITDPANVTALRTMDYGFQVEQAKLLKAELAEVSALQTFNTELERMQTGLDNSAVEAYTSSMEKLVDVLEELNDVLAEDNKGTFGGGTGVSVASMMKDGQLGGGSGTGSTEQLDRLNMLVSQLVSLTEESNRYSKGTMRAVNGNLQLGV